MQTTAEKSTPQSLPESLNVIGESVQMKKIMEIIEQVAPTDITVLITGESGVGKEVIARAIFETSNRHQKPMVTVNCGAIPEGIIESELFGHERGSFTGASDQRKGYFELADSGTIFLDEIGELPLSAQVKFLRVLENGEFLRVGSSKPRTVNVRVIAATNKDLEAEVRHNRFRADLFFRLRSVNIQIPPLRQRTEDIPLFVKKFADATAARNDLQFGGISQDALQRLEHYHWPGNVRELRNVVESMIVLERGKRIEADDVSKYLKDYNVSPGERNLPVHVNKSVEQAERELILRALLEIKGDLIDLKNVVAAQLDHDDGSKTSRAQILGPDDEDGLSLLEMERKLIIEALDRFKSNRRLAARALHISERTLYRKIKEYGLA
ncbi:MAG TPA: sigma-54 dependent transcriptional regulator [Bacteroidota bacterium]